jgi:hypothetical protein
MSLGINATFAFYYRNYGIPKRSLSDPCSLTMLGSQNLGKGERRGDCADPVFQAFRKQRALPAIRPLNKAPRPILPQIAQVSYGEYQMNQCVFTQPGSLATDFNGNFTSSAGLQ